jgi:hypothetical protein
MEVNVSRICGVRPRRQPVEKVVPMLVEIARAAG